MKTDKIIFNGFSQQYVDFFVELTLNNSKQWYEENKQRFIEHCKRPFEALAFELYEHISKYTPDIDVKPHVSRIHKDMRHYHGGMMYNDHLWLSVRSALEDWAQRPMFWFGMNPSGYDYGMGYFSIPRDQLTCFRQRIDANPHRFRQVVINAMSKQDSFKLCDEKYKRRLGDHDEDIMEWYQAKELYVICERPLEDRVFSPGLADMLKSDFDRIRDVYLWFLEMHESV